LELIELLHFFITLPSSSYTASPTPEKDVRYIVVQGFTLFIKAYVARNISISMILSAATLAYSR